MAQQFLATPGMAAVAQSASYTIGSQKVFMAVAERHPETPGPAGSDATVQPSAIPFTIFTMAVATTWNSHLLVWLMSANQIHLLDHIGKSRVCFGRAAEAPLYPRTGAMRVQRALRSRRRCEALFFLPCQIFGERWTREKMTMATATMMMPMPRTSAPLSRSPRSSTPRRTATTGLTKA